MGVARAKDRNLDPATGMHKLPLFDSKSYIRNVLCLGAHCDDIEIGCGGTILRMLQENPKLKFYWVVFSSTPQRKREALSAFRMFLGPAARSSVVIRNFRDSFFPYEGKVIKEFFESIKKKFQPDLIFTHYRHDLHQDHRVVSELTWNAFRDHFILEYEIPKYDGDLGSPNLFVGIDEALCERKIRNVMTAFRSQSGKQWFSEDTFRALLRIRGVESNAKGRYAEGFYCRKALV
jgi:LmbE family N-acetylglucosaminyl deacetylase